MLALVISQAPTHLVIRPKAQQLKVGKLGIRTQLAQVVAT